MNLDDLTGSEKLAILLSQYPKEVTSKILKEFPKDEVQLIMLEIAQMPDLEPEVVNGVIEEFNSFYVSNKSVVQGGITTAKEILEGLYAPDEVDEIFKQLASTVQSVPLDSLKKIDALTLSNILQDAHHQIVAILLCYIDDSAKAGFILNNMKQESQDLIIKGIASIEKTGPSEEMVSILEDYLDSKVGNMDTRTRNGKLGGVEAIIPIMNQISRSTEQNIMQKLEYDSPALAEEIKKKMFVFEDLINLADRDLGLILQNVTDTKAIAISLRHCSESIREEMQQKFFSCLSSRKTVLIKDEMELATRVRRKELEEAQQSITSVAKALADEGQISLGGDDFV